MADEIRLVFPDLAETAPWKKAKGQLCAYTGEGGFNFRLPDDDDTESGGWGDGVGHDTIVKPHVLNVGTGTLEIVYTADGVNLITETIGTRTNTGKWKWFKKKLANSLLPFHDLFELNGDASFRIQSSDQIHLSALKLKDRSSGATRLWEAGDAAPTAHPTLESDGYSDGDGTGFSVDETQIIIKSGNVQIHGGVLDAASITATQIANATITATQIANATITAAQIANATITGANIANATISGSNIQAATITGSNIAAATITGSNIASATISGANIQSATITGSNIAAATIGGSNIQNATITGSNIASGTITSANILNGTIVSADIASATITGANIASGTIAATNIQALTITANEIANLTITAAQIANATITAAQIANATITGGLIASATIGGSNIAGGTITGSNIAGSTITGANIQSATITGALIANSTITGSNIAAATITATNIASGTITAAQIASGTITTTQLSATAIDGMTITGSTIRTASSGARTEMNATNLFGLGFGGIGGYNGSAVQWYAKNSDGKLYAGAGNVIIDASGIALGYTNSGYFKFSIGAPSAASAPVLFAHGQNSVGGIGNHVGAILKLQTYAFNGTTNKDSEIYLSAGGWGQGASLSLVGSGTDSTEWAELKGHLAMSADATYDIGVANAVTRRPRNIYASGTVAIGTTSTASGKLRVAGAIVPDADNTYDIGTNSLRWSDVWISSGGALDLKSGSGSRYKTNLQTAQIYVKSDKLVVHYRTSTNQSRFYYITLTGTSNPTWTYSATEP